MLTKDLAICIRATDFSETSQIVTFFARESGKISAIAKGAKRPKSKFDGPIEVFAHGGIVFSDSNREKLATLTEFQQQGGFAGSGGDLFILHCCLFAVELLNSLTEDCDPHPGLFDSFLRFLQGVHEHRARHKNGGQASSIEHRDILLLLIQFQLSLLKEVGLIPVFDACVNCKIKQTTDGRRQTTDDRRQTSDEFYFSSSANGLICRDCESSFPDKIRLSKKAAGCLGNLKLLADADKKTLNEIEKLLIHHFTEILRYRPKMAKYILE